MAAPSPFWGDEVIWNTVVTGHSNEMDQKARAWNTTSHADGRTEMPRLLHGRLRPSVSEALRRWASPAVAAAAAVSTRCGIRPRTSSRSSTPASRTFHLNFDNDPNNTIYSGGGGVVGWVNTNVWDKTKDAGQAQGWTVQVVDTNGNGKRDEYTEPNAPFDPAKDRAHHPGLLRRHGQSGGQLRVVLADRLSRVRSPASISGPTCRRRRDWR